MDPTNLSLIITAVAQYGFPAVIAIFILWYFFSRMRKLDASNQEFINNIVETQKGMLETQKVIVASLESLNREMRDRNEEHKLFAAKIDALREKMLDCHDELRRELVTH